MSLHVNFCRFQQHCLILKTKKFFQLRQRFGYPTPLTIFENRHKHKKVEALCKSVSQLDKAQIETFYLFGANDIAERVIDTSIAMGITPVVIDSFKAGQTCKGIKVRAFKRYDFSPSNVVVICSLSHQNAMQKLLEQHEFEGLVLRV